MRREGTFACAMRAGSRRLSRTTLESWKVTHDPRETSIENAVHRLGRLRELDEGIGAIARK